MSTRMESLTEWLRAAERRLRRMARTRALTSIALVVAGLVLLAYVASQYSEMYLEQKHLAEQWAQQQQQNQVESPQAVPVDDSVMRLVIPKIDLTSFVVEGTNHHALLLGPGHMKNTVEPGEVGNAVISGHRDTFFRHIHELEKGDQVYIERGGRRIVYEVTGKKIVEPDDVSVAAQTKDSELTLITCYPTYYIGPAPKRLVVFTKMASAKDNADNAKPDDAQLKRAAMAN